MDSEELLAQLADIHLPQAVGYWPPAPGWWVLALLLLFGGFLLLRSTIRRSHQNHIREHALAELERCYQSSQELLREASKADIGGLTLRYVNEFNAVIRRVALVHYPHAKLASLGGEAWVDFIRQSGDSSALSDEIAAALSYGRFQSECEVDVAAMNRMGQQWISSLYTDRSPTTDASSPQSTGNQPADTQMGSTP